MKRKEITAIALATVFAGCTLAAGILFDHGHSGVAMACAIVASISLIAAIPTALDCVNAL